MNIWLQKSQWLNLASSGVVCKCIYGHERAKRKVLSHEQSVVKIIFLK